MKIEISDEMYNNLVNNESADVRRVAAELGLGFDALKFDERDIVRAAVARKGYGLNELAQDESELVRQAVVQSADISLLNEMANNDLSESVRTAAMERLNVIRGDVARQGYGLNELAQDESELVRQAVEQYVDESLLNEMANNDLSESVRTYAKERLDAIKAQNTQNNQSKSYVAEAIQTIYQSFDKYYNQMYDNGNYSVAQYVYDKSIDYVKDLAETAPEIIHEFNKYRGDFLSSDREYAALGYALADFDFSVREIIEDKQNAVYLDHPKLLMKQPMPSDKDGEYKCKYVYELGHSSATGEVFTAEVTGVAVIDDKTQNYTFTVLNTFQTDAENIPNIFYPELKVNTQVLLKSDLSEIKKSETEKSISSSVVNAFNKTPDVPKPPVQDAKHIAPPPPPPPRRSKTGKNIER